MNDDQWLIFFILWFLSYFVVIGIGYAAYKIHMKRKNKKQCRVCGSYYR